MKVVRTVGELSRNPNSIVTVGTFDGVHLAHQEILREVVRRAGQRRGRSVVITFDPHPKEVVTSPRGNVLLLTTLEERLSRMDELGIDLVYVIRFTVEFSRLTAREFLEHHVQGSVGVAEVVIGYDHMFGRDRLAGKDELEAMGRELGFAVDAIAPLLVDGDPVSSTRIRKSLGAGDVERASRFLGRPYKLAGTVMAGDGRGRKLGFPTANLVPLEGRKVVPRRGVYLVGVTAGGQKRFGMMNIGVRPTVVARGAETLEVHILGFDGDLYGTSLEVAFLRRLRDERRFGSEAELERQQREDESRARDIIESMTTEHTSQAW